MKKLFTTILCAAFAVVAFAQSTDLYKMRSTQDAEKVLKAISAELKLEGDAFAKVRDILVKSAESQAEIAQRKEMQTDEMQDAIVKRQTAHIENNLKSALTDAQYQTYLNSKDKIQAAVNKLRGSK